MYGRNRRRRMGRRRRQRRPRRGRRRRSGRPEYRDLQELLQRRVDGNRQGLHREDRCFRGGRCRRDAVWAARPVGHRRDDLSVSSSSSTAPSPTNSSMAETEARAGGWRYAAPVGFANSGGLVFVDEPAEEVAAVEAKRRFEWCCVAAVGRQQRQGAVWPVFVVVTAVDPVHV